MCRDKMSRRVPLLSFLLFTVHDPTRARRRVALSCAYVLYDDSPSRPGSRANPFYSFGSTMRAREEAPGPDATGTAADTAAAEYTEHVHDTLVKCRYHAH